MNDIPRITGTPDVPEPALPPVYDVWPHRFTDRCPRHLQVDQHPVITPTAPVYLAPVPGLPGTLLRGQLTPDGKGLLVMRQDPASRPKDLTTAANALRRTAWSLDQDRPDAPVLYLDPALTKRVQLVRTVAPAPVRETPNTRRATTVVPSPLRAPLAVPTNRSSPGSGSPPGPARSAH